MPGKGVPRIWGCAMSLFSFRFLSHGSSVGAAVLACAVIVGGAAFAQSEGNDDRSPVVSIAGDGSDVNAIGANVTVTGATGHVRAAGARVTVAAVATGQVWILGAEVSFAGKANAVRAGGANVDVRGEVDGDAALAGAVVRTTAKVGGDLQVAGANVGISGFSDVGGNLRAAGANVTIGGHIGGDVKAAGAVVTFAGQTEGSVYLAGYTVRIGEDARINGDLTIASANDPVIADGAVISGKVSHVLPPSWWHQTPWAVKITIALAVAAGTILTGIVLMLFGGRIFATATGHVRQRPLSSVLFGILTVILVSFVALVLVATVIGLSAGFAVGLLLPFLVVFGHAVAAAGVAGGILIRGRETVGVALNLVMLIIGAIVLVALGLIPFAGPAIVCIAILVGVGALTRTIGYRLRHPAMDGGM